MITEQNKLQELAKQKEEEKQKEEKKQASPRIILFGLPLIFVHYKGESFSKKYNYGIQNICQILK